MVMHFNTCCCGCSLKTGTVFVGIMEAIGYFITLIGCSVGANTLMSVPDISEPVVTYPGSISFLTLSDEINTINDVKNTVSYSIGGVLAFIAAVSALRLLFSIMLVFGGSADRPALIKPWIVCAIVMKVVETIIDVALIVLVFNTGATAGGIVLLFVTFLSVIIHVYFILVVNSYHTTLLQDNTTRPMH